MSKKEEELGHMGFPCPGSRPVTFTTGAAALCHGASPEFRAEVCKGHMTQEASDNN